ncbi:phosphoribosylglycinamide formyltransferase [Phytohabitans sp. LJ34]|uniref:phosphoribosylglycinamide formyltransferase n=1 Tax=Phytohabitans sp. LJ34 TaxID=3452217 RepID=UPI003F89AAFC
MGALKIGMMVSGRGVALRMALRACGVEPSPGSVVAVAANMPCPALQVARDAGIAHVGLFEIDKYGTRSVRDAAIAEFFLAAGANFVFTAGYMDVVDATLVDRFPNRVLSIYPSLLPAYAEEPDTIGAPLRDGVKLIGVSFHLRRALSGAGGPIIAQCAIPVDVDDTVATVDPKVAEVEDRLLPGILQAFAEDRVVIEGNRARIWPRSDEASPSGADFVRSRAV